MDFMAAHPEAMICCTEEIWIRGGLRHNPGKRHKKYSGWIFDNVLPLCLLSLSSALFRREVFEDIGGFDETLPACEDYDLGIRLAHKYPIPFFARASDHKAGRTRATSSPTNIGEWTGSGSRALEKALSLGLTTEAERLMREEIIKKSRDSSPGILQTGKSTGNRKISSDNRKSGVRS